MSTPWSSVPTVSFPVGTTSIGIDDPIAHCIVSGQPNFPTNEVLAKGGHTDYWVEKRVCGKLMRMIAPRHRHPTDIGAGAMLPR